MSVIFSPYRVVVLFCTKTSVRADVLELKVLSVGVRVAVSTCLPVTAGFHEQVAEVLG